MTTAAHVEGQGKQFAREHAGVVRAAAKIGFLARGVTWITIGILAFRLASGVSKKSADRSGALQEIGSKPFGKFMLVVIAIAFAAYALYNLAAGAFDFDGKGAGDRVLRFVRTVLYGTGAWTAYHFATGSKVKADKKQSVDFTAKMMDRSMGPLLVGLIGVVLIAAGIYNASKAFGKKYEEGLQTFELSPANEKIIGLLARVGYISRGAVFAVVGLLFIQAARTHNAGEATGLDGALRRLLKLSYGRPLVAVLGIGLVAFGLFSLVEARYRKIETS
ncbi:MAG: DUF1206 domain-containing protein [Pseudonocardiales bacterium]